MDSKLKIYLSYLAKLDSILPPSSRTDFILFLLGIKPCIRTELKTHNTGCEQVRSWCNDQRLYCYIDDESFVYIAYQKVLMEKVIYLDHSPFPHEEPLGEALGYPSCCCKKIAAIGEMNIDSYELEFSPEDFQGKFQRISPLEYTEGRAYISHAPCCPTCRPSLIQAELFTEFVVQHSLQPWAIINQEIY